jgi:hypothetical protein
MNRPISDAVRRFVLASIPSVPHIEALLLAWRDPDSAWSCEQIAKRIFVSPARAETVADDLCQADLFRCAGHPKTYRCRREPPSLAALLDEVDSAYSHRLREMTTLIHANAGRKAARFAQAFTWDKK